MTSPNNTLIGLGQSIIDASGNVWAINNGQVTINGSADSTTANVTHLAYAGSIVWQENTQNLWWSKSSPTASWQPPYGTSAVPVAVAASLNDTLVNAAYGSYPNSITDSSGNTWTIANGQVVINGIADLTTANVTHLAYVNGQVWQENTSDLWWSKATPASAWEPSSGTSAVPLPVTSSAPDTIINTANGYSADYITDPSGNIWRVSNGQVSVNGTLDPTTANVTHLAYVDGEIWQENASDLWWSKTTPAASWQPNSGTPIAPVFINSSPNDSVMGVNQYGTSGVLLVDASGNLWSISGGKVVVNGAADPTTANVIELGYVNGKVWQENTAGLWWSKSAPADAWTPANGTSANPLQNAAITFLNSAAEPATTINIGQMSQSIQTPPGPSLANLVTTGVVADGTNLVFASYAGDATLVVDGNSSISGTGSLLVREYDEAQTPLGVMQNNGTMTLNDSTLWAGTMTGTGVINATNGSTVSVDQVPTSSETIHLADSHLNIGASLSFIQATRPVTFNAPISMGIGSGVSLVDIQATAADFNATTGQMLLWTGNSTSGYREIADLQFVGEAKVYASTYAATASSPGGTLLSIEPLAHPLLPPTS